MINPFFTLQAAIVNSQTLEEVARLEQVCFAFCLLQSLPPQKENGGEKSELYENL